MNTSVWTVANNLAGLVCDLAASGCDTASRWFRQQAQGHYQAIKTTRRQRRGW